MVDSIFPERADTIAGIDKNKEYFFDNCRVAAIMHDCGHGPFSHLSEQLYSSQLNEIKAANSVLYGANAHEIISYFITTSAPMKKFNDEVIKKFYGIDIDLDFVGEMIVGYIDRSAPKRAYGFAVEIINGAFDADKLDYILRDAHSTGIRMTLELPRLMYTLNVIPDTEGVNRLAIDISGVSALEGIVFNKMMLTSAIYHHQKVRAAGCMLKGIISDSGKFNSVLDYLEYTDDMIFCMLSSNSFVAKRIDMLKNRMLPKRAFCFSPRTLEDISKIEKIMGEMERKEFRENVEALISSHIKEKYNKDVSVNEIWIDSPSNPKFKEAAHCLIKSEGSENNYITLRDVFPTDDWVRAFSQNKWRGFVYSMPENCKEVSEASKYVMERVFDTQFNLFATKLCKVD